MDLREQIIAEIRKIYDPEIPVNIYELGLIYDVKVKNTKAKIIMTLTTPNCPVAESLPKEVKDSAMQVEGIEEVDLDLVEVSPNAAPPVCRIMDFGKYLFEQNKKKIYQECFPKEYDYIFDLLYSNPYVEPSCLSL